jgi:hypothetical protein
MMGAHQISNTLRSVGIFVALFLALQANPLHASDVSLTVASCPPWKHEGDKAMNEKMVEMCKLDSQKITQALASTFQIESQDQHSLLQEQATPENLIAKLDELRGSVSRGDTLYFFQMSHGGIVPHSYKGYQVNGEVFAYYTEQKPDFSKAVSDGQWMSARELRDAISHFATDTGANVVVIIEACHSSSAGHSLVHNPVERLDAEERIAYLFSAGAKQTSTFTDDNTQARFTRDLVRAMDRADSGTSLADMFNEARETTHRGALASCNELDEKARKALLGSVDQYFENCLQHPSYLDAKGLMLDLVKQ